MAAHVLQFIFTCKINGKAPGSYLNIGETDYTSMADIYN
jgi:hypothetical protein